MKKLLFTFFIFLCGYFSAQVDILSPKDPLVKDPYFNQTPGSISGSPSEKVTLINADEFIKDPNAFEGNPYFKGNVQFLHKGATLTANEVIFYQKENFLKARGNVVLITSDGNRITAGQMEYDGQTQKGIARQNVVLTDPKQTIKTEVLYYDRIPNTAYFNSGGTIFDGESEMKTRSATYNLNTKSINFSGNVVIDNPKYIVEGSNIVQNQNTNAAEFFGPTKIINKEKPSNYVYTEKGKFLQNSNEVFLNKNSRIHYNGKILTGKEMYFNRNTGYGKAEGNVTLDDPKEKRYIKGGYGEIYEKKDSAMITKNPYAVKILEKDSLFFAAEKFLTYQKPDTKDPQKKKSFLRAFHKTRFFKSNAQARADSLSFNETDGIMHLYKSPILWSGQRQVSGDKIEAYFNTVSEDIDSLKVIGNAFAITKVDSLNLKDEFHQVKGRLMTVFYENGDMKIAKVLGNAQAITFADSEDEKTKELERVGVILSSCGEIEALFEDNKVQVISCNIGALQDIYPMSKIEPDKKKFPDFNWNTKDRLRKWQDIFLDTPNYEEIKYESVDELYLKAEAERKKLEDAKKPKTLKRIKR